MSILDKKLVEVAKLTIFFKIRCKDTNTYC